MKGDFKVVFDNIKIKLDKRKLEAILAFLLIQNSRNTIRISFCKEVLYENYLVKELDQIQIILIFHSTQQKI